MCDTQQLIRRDYATTSRAFARIAAYLAQRGVSSGKLAHVAISILELIRKPLETLVQRIVKAHDIDIVILAEMNATTPNEMAAALSHFLGRPAFQLLPDGLLRQSRELRRFDPLLVRPVYDTSSSTGFEAHFLPISHAEP